MSPMRILCTLILAGVYLCGCSRGRDTSSQSLLDRVQPSRDVSFGHYVLHVDKRDGTSLEGVRIVSTEPDGQITTITASIGTLSQVAERSTITIDLRGAHTEKAKQKAL